MQGLSPPDGNATTIGRADTTMKSNIRTVDQILASALRKEEAARDFYAELAIGCNVDFVRDLLEKLRNEEEKHGQLIRSMQARLNSGRKPL